jgi:hypothetical protein
VFDVFESRGASNLRIVADVRAEHATSKEKLVNDDGSQDPFHGVKPPVGFHLIVDGGLMAQGLDGCCHGDVPGVLILICFQ